MWLRRAASDLFYAENPMAHGGGEHNHTCWHVVEAAFESDDGDGGSFCKTAEIRVFSLQSRNIGPMGSCLSDFQRLPMGCMGNGRPS